MKQDEKVSCKVHPVYLKSNDQQLLEQYPIKTDRYLYIDIEMIKLVRVEDIYKDGGSSLQKTLLKGVGTASPYSDFMILSKSSKFVSNG